MAHQPKPSTLNRRHFITSVASTWAGIQFVPGSVLGKDGRPAPSNRITLACIGLGGQGTQNMMTFAHMPDVQVVSVCDVNREGGGYLSWTWGKGGERRPAGREPARRMIDAHYGNAKRSGTFKACTAYADYRELMARKNVDAVMIATPDHAHAVITLAALKRKMHVYCEKPLTWSVKEARQVTEAARAAGVATQMGNQGQASEEARLIQEYILDGAIGPVREVRAWTPARFWQTALYEGRPEEQPPVPDSLDWNLWLGPAAERSYHPAYHPWSWRNWWDFGTGQIGDLGAHKLSTVFKALELGQPESVHASCTKLNAETYPQGVILRYRFPARGIHPPLTLTWHDGGLQPAWPEGLEPGRRIGDVTYIGDDAVLMGHRLVPEQTMKAYGRPPRVLKRSPGHHREWIDACKGGPRAGSDFVTHAGPMTEALMLGNVAVRAQRPLKWDGENLRIPNAPDAERWLQRDYRDDW